MSINYPVYKFDSGLTEFSFYLLVINVIGVFLTLVFSTKNSQNTLKTMFATPSVLFLILFGMIIEFLAASSKVLRLDNIIVESLLFASIYAGGSFVIAYYNKTNNINRHLLAATLPGLILEVSVGISADLGRGNTYFTAYFTIALICGIALGRYLGVKASSSEKLVEI